METQIAKVVDVKDSVKGVKIITLDMAINFKPGQWIYAFVEKWGMKIKKPYTIASLPNEQIELLVEDVGYVSSKLCALKPGDELEISNVFGVFTINDSAKNIVFIAFDTGIAPFKSTVQAVDNSYVELIYISEKDEMMYEDYFNDLAKSKNFKLRKHTGLKKEEFSKKLKTTLQEIKNVDAVYICGLIYLVEAARAVCNELGIENVYFENYV